MKVTTDVLPAHAGMAREGWGQGPRNAGFSPHTRGWPVNSDPKKGHPFEFSPHTRGWPDLGPHGHAVGGSSPRTRGDGPCR